jgi:hypothetical protein
MRGDYRGPDGKTINESGWTLEILLAATKKADLPAK